MNPSATRLSVDEDKAFLQAIAELGRLRPLTTSQAIRDPQGALLVEAGARVDQDFHDRLVAQRLAAPLDACVDPGNGINAASLRAAAEAALQRWPFFAQMAPPGRTRGMLLEAIAAIPLPRPVALAPRRSRARPARRCSTTAC